MRGTSAASLSSLLEVTEAQKASAALGTELFGVVAVLDSTGALRRVLTDPSVEPEAKANLAEEVFGEKLSAGALVVTRAAVASRWSAARDLGDAIEIAGVRALVATVDEAGSEQVQDELFSFSRIIASDPELRQTLTDRNVAVDAKVSLVRSILDGKASDVTIALAAQAVHARNAKVERSLTSFAALAAEYRKRLVAEVRVAKELTETERDRLSAVLARKYGHAVHMNIAVDPDVVGGIMIAIGDQTIDGSISSKLQDAKRRIAG